jgi:tetratricopeptide (TPR) repeat protein
MRLSRSALLIVALSSAGTATLLAQESSNPRLIKASILFERGLQALQVGNLNKAEAKFARALTISPDLPEAHLGRGHVLMGRRQFYAALQAYLEAEDCYLRESASLLELRRERYAAAQARASDLRRRLHILRENIARHEELGGDASGRSEERQKSIGSSLQLEVRQIEVELERLDAMPAPPPPTEDGVPGELYRFLGDALNHLGRVDVAVESWEICAQRSPSDTLAHNNLVAGYLALHRCEQARANLERARMVGVIINPELEAEVQRQCAAGSAPDGD